VSVQCEGTRWKLPRTVVGPATCHLCVSECWYPGPVTAIVHEAEPDHLGGAAAPPEAGWRAAADAAATASAAAESRGRGTLQSLSRRVALDFRRDLNLDLEGMIDADKLLPVERRLRGGSSGAVRHR